MSIDECGRFAPSITGAAHPGTLLAALLAWLDARSQNARFVLRLEDLDILRRKPGQREQMVEALQWLGLDWDHLDRQSELACHHEDAIDNLAKAGVLYPCSCSRRELRERCERAPDNSFAYDNACRTRSLPAAGWRESSEALRVRLPDTRVELVDESGTDLSQTPALDMGDPVIVRRDGVYAYHLVVVVDDAQRSVTRVVRGNDLATSTATQIQLQSLLGLSTPRYRHHLLLMEEAGEKLAKLHKSLPFGEIREMWSATAFCGLLAKLCGLRSEADGCTPQELLAEFSWSKVVRDNQRFDSTLAVNP